jgi:hypothetical protein
MSKRSHKLAGRGGEEGYALLLVVFLTTLLLLATMVAAPSVRTERKREKEEEMIWRGKQYVRAIKLYYRKNGKFPTSLDDLTKPKTGSLRYLRQAYKDPMNKEDGSWRLIYVGPAGQLIGSLKPPQTLQLQGAGQPGTPAAALGSQGTAQGTAQGTSQSAFGPQGPGTTAGASAFGGGTSNTTAGTTQGGAFGSSNSGTASTPFSLSSSDSSPIFGGNIIGIGSKIDRKSVAVYEKATNYHLFEFIWDPSKDVMGIGGAIGTQVGTPVPPGQGFGQGFGQPIQNPAGSQPTSNPNTPNSPNSPMQELPPLTPNSPPPQ